MKKLHVVPHIGLELQSSPKLTCSFSYQPIAIIQKRVLTLNVMQIFTLWNCVEEDEALPLSATFLLC